MKRPPATPTRPQRPSAERRPTTTKDGMHPRSRHRGRYDFAVLIACLPALKSFVAINPYGDASIDFADPKAVTTLNTAILRHTYGVAWWEIPHGFLCPPIPGRADHIHHAADVLARSNGGTPPRGPAVRVLDVGVGANCIYPLIGHHEYGWSFVGSDCNPKAVAAARRIIAANPGLAGTVTCRAQPDPSRIFAGVVAADERFDLSLCNPPFHGSPQEAQAGTMRKLRNLGRAPAKGRRAPTLNFGGTDTELWCPGGEGAFICQMIAESRERPDMCLWFTSLVAKEANLPRITAALKAAKPTQMHVIDMAQGQKRSRLIAWTFLDQRQHRVWQAAHWKT